MSNSRPADMSIGDILDLRKLPRDGEEVGSVSGKIAKVWEIKRGRGDYGDWSFQNLELDDGRDKIKVTLKDRDELDARDWEGVRAIFSSTDGKNGWNGVKAKDDEYKGKVTRILWITGAANIAEERGSAPSSSRRDERADERDARRDDRRDDRKEDRRRDERSERREERRDERREEPRDNRREERRDDKRASDKQWKPLGITVGMAINNACTNLTARNLPLEPTPVWETASDLLRVALKLERGFLAETHSRRTGPKEERKEERREEQPREQQRESAPTGDKASDKPAEPEDPEGDDIPF